VVKNALAAPHWGELTVQPRPPGWTKGGEGEGTEKEGRDEETGEDERGEVGKR